MGKKSSQVMTSQENLERLRFEARIILKRVLNEAEEALEKEEDRCARMGKIFELESAREELYALLKKGVLYECAAIEASVEE